MNRLLDEPDDWNDFLVMKISLRISRLDTARRNKLVSAACRALSAEELKWAMIFASTEPRAMCLDAIYWSGIKSIVDACPASMLEQIAGEGLC